MNHREIEMSDVIVVLEELDDAATQAAVAALKLLGMCVESIDNDNSVVEGCVETCKIGDIKKIEHVRYIRNVFNYEAEQAVDGPEGACDPEPDQYED
jgi:hypothetical protein